RSCGLLGLLGARFAFLARDRALRIAALFPFHHARFIEKAQHPVGRQRALSKPSLDLLEIELEALGLVLRQQRIEMAEPLDEAAVARRAAVSDHDMMNRPFLRAGAGETDFQGHYCSSFQLFDNSNVDPVIPDGMTGACHFFFPNPGNPPSPGGLPPRPGSNGPPGSCGGTPGMVGGRPGAPGAPPGSPGNPPGILSASFCISCALGMPAPSPSMLASPAIGPRLPEPIAFITSAILRCILSMRLTSSTRVPEPAAMRFLRLALSTSGFLRSCGVIESMIATWRLSTRSSRFADASRFFILV